MSSKLRITTSYGVTPNHVLKDKNLSLKAKGLFGYLQSKPDGWVFSVERISQESCDGKDSVRSGLQELENAGFLLRKAIKGEDGMFNGYDYELSENPFTDNPSTDSQLTENGVTLSKKDSSKKENSKKDVFLPPQEKPVLSGLTKKQRARNDYTEDFEAFWKVYPNKAAKVNAYASWKRIAPDETTQAQIIAAVVAYKMSKSWRQNQGQFIPHAATFLNQERYLEPPHQVAQFEADSASRYSSVPVNSMKI